MSSRALRKLQKENDFAVEAAVSEEKVSKPISSLFALLAGDSSDDDDGVNKQEFEASERSQASPPVQPKRKNKKKNKKKEDDFDQLLAEFKSSDIKDEASTKATNWLSVDEALLNPDREMRKKFGDLGEEGEVRPVLMITKRKATRKLRRQLIEPRPNWPPITAVSVGMHLEFANGVWQLVESPEQVVLSEELREIVELGDISLLAQHVRMHPWHVDAVLIYSDYLRMHSVGEAAEMVEMAVLCLERALLADGFSLWSEDAQLPYPAGSNRCFYLAILRHLQYLTRRGCYRTALELSKLALRLDLSDPVGIAFLMEFLAAKCAQEDAKVKEWFLSEQSQFEEPLSWALTRALIRKQPGCELPADCMVILTALKDGEVTGSPYTMALSKLYVARNEPLWKGCTLKAQESAGLVEPSLNAQVSLYRHIILTDLPNVNVSIPAHLSWMPVHALDPIPPEMLVDAHDSRRCIIS